MIRQTWLERKVQEDARQFYHDVLAFAVFILIFAACCFLAAFLDGCAHVPQTLHLPPGVMVNYVEPGGDFNFKGLGAYRVHQEDGKWVVVLRKGDPNAPEFLRWELAAIAEDVQWDADKAWNSPKWN